MTPPPPCRPLPAADIARVCSAVLPLPSTAGGTVPLLAISHDEALLAICASNTVDVHSTQRLIDRSATTPLRTLQLPSSATQFAWQPSAVSSIGAFAALMQDGTVVSGSMDNACAPKPLQGAPGLAAAVAFSPDGASLAVGHGDCVSVCGFPAGGVRFTLRVLSQEVHDADVEALEVDSIAWLTPTCLLVNSKLMEGGKEQGFAPLCTLWWDPSAPALTPTPPSLHLHELFATNTVEGVGARGPWLQTAALPQWRALVYSHRKSNDDHIKVCVCGVAGGRKALEAFLLYTSN
jgi:hypothetical protein